MSLLKGKELDRIFKEEGVIDEDSLSEDDDVSEEVTPKDDNEIIGHMQSKDGEDLGQLVVMNKSTNKIRLKHRNFSGTF